MDITRRLLQQRIDSGEITQGDVDLFRRGYRYIILSTGLGALIGLPVWAFMSRRRPLPSLANRIGTSLIMSSSGSFLGFTIGGAAAAMEVNRHMVDSQRLVRRLLLLSSLFSLILLLILSSLFFSLFLSCSLSFFLSTPLLLFVYSSFLLSSLPHQIRSLCKTANRTERER